MTIKIPRLQNWGQVQGCTYVSLCIIIYVSLLTCLCIRDNRFCSTCSKIVEKLKPEIQKKDIYLTETKEVLKNA